MTLISAPGVLPSLWTASAVIVRAMTIAAVYLSPEMKYIEFADMRSTNDGLSNPAAEKILSLI